MARLAKIKRDARKALHLGMSVDAVYTPRRGAPPADTVPVRIHNRRRVEGGMGPNGFTDLLVTEDRLVFDREVLAERGITLNPGDQFEIPDYGETYRLVDMDLSDGPVNEYWRANRV